MNIENVKKYTKIYINSLSYATTSSFYDAAYKQFQLEKLDNAETLDSCLYVINKGNRFDFLNFLYKYGVITEQECADTIYSIWTTQERFYDCGIAKTKMVKFMKMAEKIVVLPDSISKLSDDAMITVYRGVKHNDYKGLSWTIDKKIAIWFAKRFSNNVDKCYVFSGKLMKKDIIAYFDQRGESEIVCDYRRVKEITCEEIEILKSNEGSKSTNLEMFDLTYVPQ